MVAIIGVSRSIRGCFFYNEQKVDLGKAVCLMAENFQLDLLGLSVEDKLSMLLKVIAMNSRSKVNAVHISLNFSPKDKLSDELMRQIAAVYMSRIGFDNQPYLVYRHQDAGHPHLHIVTTNIQLSGQRISLHHLAKDKS